MAEIKYQYALNENDELVNIKQITKENRNEHVYRCLGCGHDLLPRAIGSKYRHAHFYHRELVDCSGETYLHKLGKRYIKELFESSKEFKIEYPVTFICKQKNCRLRNINCEQKHQLQILDLKKYYDVCKEEQPIAGFVADLLLTSSEHPEISPVLIEICVSHPCEEVKRNSGLKIIEIKIKKESDISFIQENGMIIETVNIPKKQKHVEFISFKRDVEKQNVIPITRYVFNPERCINGYFTRIDCQHADFKMRKDSKVELNIIPFKGWMHQELHIPLLWMYKHYNLWRCSLCKFYYSTMYESSPKCRLGKKYGGQDYPSQDAAEYCRKFSINLVCFPNQLDEEYFIEEIRIQSQDLKPEYNVIIAGSSSFTDEQLFKEKCRYYLSDKIETHQIIILSGTSWITTSMIEQLSNELPIQIESYEAEWDKDGKNAPTVSQEKMLKYADALIVFWDGKSIYTRNLIEAARSMKKKVAVVLSN